MKKRTVKLIIGAFTGVVALALGACASSSQPVLQESQPTGYIIKDSGK
jgi:hypothetical protein